MASKLAWARVKSALKVASNLLLLSLKTFAWTSSFGPNHLSENPTWTSFISLSLAKLLQHFKLRATPVELVDTAGQLFVDSCSGESSPVEFHQGYEKPFDLIWFKIGLHSRSTTRRAFWHKVSWIIRIRRSPVWRRSEGAGDILLVADKGLRLTGLD